jgi:hypothetical protein
MTNISSELVTKLQNATSKFQFTFDDLASHPTNIYSGSGFYFYETPEDLIEGLFVTAAHCVSKIIENEDGSKSRIKITCGYIQNPITSKYFKVDVNNIFIDGLADIAVIKTGIDFTQNSNFCLTINTGTVNAGDVCYVMGNPGALDEDSISNGIVRDSIWCDPSGKKITESIFISAPSSSGNSGGPIVDVNGEVIGMHSFSFNDYESFSGGPNKTVLSNSLSVLKGGNDYKSKLYLGVAWKLPNIFDLNKYYANNNPFHAGGLIITSVDVISPFHTPDEQIAVDDLIISCTVTSDNNIILFGNDINQTSLGKLLYYPLNTQINITYRKIGIYQDKNKTITLNKTYNDVEDHKDSFYEAPGYPLRINLKQIS